MSVDFTKFPFSTVVRPDAATLTEAITADAVDSGFVIITVKGADKSALAAAARTFVNAVRAASVEPGLVGVTAYRQLRRDELGGAMPFDQPICESILTGVATSDHAGIGSQAMASVLENSIADWLFLLEFRTPEVAVRSAQSFSRDADDSFSRLASTADHTTVGAFRNMKRYSSVSKDTNVIHFFNLFGAPGDLDNLWAAWQEALPWFFDVAEFRSSFPLLARDPNQPILLVNYAHLDSAKHFLNGSLHDPAFARLIATCYVQRNVSIPSPFFCKIAPM